MLDNLLIKKLNLSITIWNMIDQKCVHINIKFKFIQSYWYETRFCGKSSYLWSTKTNFPSIAWRETNSMGLTWTWFCTGWETVWGCNRPTATRQLHPSLSGSLFSSRCTSVGDQLFKYPVLWMVQKPLWSATNEGKVFRCFIKWYVILICENRTLIKQQNIGSIDTAGTM